jgi:integrase-like protein
VILPNQEEGKGVEEPEDLPPWPHDELAKLLGMAEYNARAGAHNVPEIYALLVRVHRAFARARDVAVIVDLIESFNGRFRDECLNVQEFMSLEDAALRIEIWRQDYNRNRPHGALGNLTPSEYAKRGQDEASEGADFQLGSVRIRG